MYRGEPIEVTLQFTEKLIGSAYDKFGEGIKMTRTGDDTIQTTVTELVAVYHQTKGLDKQKRNFW